MNTIFIVTYNRDFRYLKYCLKSIVKFATGFDTVLVVPGYDFDTAVNLVRIIHPNCTVRCGEEWNGRGMLWAMAQKCRADQWCPTSELIFHIDADCVFTESVKPEDYLVDGKPILLYESFHSLATVKGHTEILPWKTCTQECLPFDIQWETMRAHPEVYHHDLYSHTRMLVEQKTGIKFDNYVMHKKNEFPQTFCEFNTLGNVAIQCFAGDYHLVNLEHEPFPKQKLRQAWSHREPTAEDMQEFKRLGLE